MVRSSDGCERCKSKNSSAHVYRCGKCGEIYCSECGKDTLFSGYVCPDCRTDDHTKFLGTGRYWEDR